VILAYSTAIVKYANVTYSYHLLGFLVVAFLVFAVLAFGFAFGFALAGAFFFVVVAFLALGFLVTLGAGSENPSDTGNGHGASSCSLDLSFVPNNQLNNLSNIYFSLNIFTSIYFLLKWLNKNNNHSIKIFPISP
jgi:hypothetical protein